MNLKLNIIPFIQANWATGLVLFSSVAITSTAAVKLADVTATNLKENEKAGVVSQLVSPTENLVTGTPEPLTTELPITGESGSGGCVVTIFGKRYSIGSLLTSHSGGNVFTCGADMSNSYRSQHGSDVTRMSRYLINSNGTVGGSGGGAGTATFTLATLAAHNKSGDCYVGFNGNVYNVSNHSSWGGCVHHGVRGGGDITSSFPHATSYLSTLPIVGTLSGGASYTGNGAGTGGDDNDSDEREYEPEREVEDDFISQNGYLLAFV